MATTSASPNQLVIPRRSIWQRLFATRQRRKAINFYLFISPWLLGFIFLSVIPLALGFYLSLTNYDGLNFDNLKYVGPKYYERVLYYEDRSIELTIEKTLRWTAYNVPVWLITSYLLALLVHSITRLKGFFRTLFYLPSIFPIVAVVWSFKQVLAGNTGLLNEMIRVVSPGYTTVWLQGDEALYSISGVSVWMGIGGGMLIFLAGLQNIPEELKEAAKIDGAGPLRVLRHVTLPLMTPVIFFQTIQGMIGAIQQFQLPMLFTGGTLQYPPPSSVYLYMVHVNMQMFGRGRFSYGLAMIWLMFAVIVGITIVLFLSARFWVFYETNPNEG